MQAIAKYKKILLRVDLNLPIKNGKVKDLSRLIAIGPTLHNLLENGCKVTICSHLGRPDPDNFDQNLSLKHICQVIEQMYKIECEFSEINATDLDQKIESLNPKKVLLLENLRKYKGEKKDDPAFSKELASHFDEFVFDAFAVAHRKNASTHEIFNHLKSNKGILIEREIKNLKPLLKGEFENPLTVILGGKKIETKIGVILNFITKAKFILIGGAMANTFLKAQGFEIGNSVYEESKINTAKGILKIASEHEAQLILPSDVVTTKDLKDPKIIEVKSVSEVKSNDYIIDIGPSTINDFQQAINESKTIIGNGPVGFYELPASLQGSKSIYKTLSEHNGKTILGGGDTIDCIRLSGISLKKFNFISTGGGAMLKYLAKDHMPALDKLNI
jgi:phosphoglycerate kinase